MEETMAERYRDITVSGDKSLQEEGKMLALNVSHHVVVEQPGPNFPKGSHVFMFDDGSIMMYNGPLNLCEVVDDPELVAGVMGYFEATGADPDWTWFRQRAMRVAESWPHGNFLTRRVRAFRNFVFRKLRIGGF